MFAALKSGAPMPARPAPAPTPAAAPQSDRPPRGGGASGGVKIKVFNIPEGTDENELKAHFSSCGEVTDIRILPVRDGKVTTLGFVTFSNNDEAQNAINQKNNEEFNGSPLRVMENAPREGGPQQGGGGSGGGGGGNSFQVKVYNIPESTEEETLKAYFATIGEVTRVKILPCREGRDTTLGFVHYTSDTDCQRAVTELNNHEFNGSQLRVQSESSGGGGSGGLNASTFGMNPSTFGMNGVNGTDEKPPAFGRGQQLSAFGSQDTTAPGPRSGGGGGGRGPQAKIFGIPPDTDREDLKSHFASAGNVKGAKIMPQREGKDNCMGFVDFETDAEVEKAVTLFDGTELNGSTLKVLNAGGGGGGGGGGGAMSFGQLNGSTFGMAPPREERPSRSNGDIMLPDGGDTSNACRRCGETGHWAKECVNAPMENGGVQAVTYIPPEAPDTENELFKQGIHQGINFEKFDNIPVRLSGENAPRPISSFEDAGLHKSCIENIKRAKYAKPTPVQKYALPAILNKRDLMACAQTGSGKTGAFLLPIMTNMLNESVPQSGDGECSFPTVCVMSPTRELAVQIYMEAKKFSFGTPIRPVVIYGGVSVGHHIEQLQRGCHICVATPGRLDDFVKRGRVSFKSLQYLVLDEADRMLDMGFGPQIKQIINNSEMPARGGRNTLMFSATFPDEIQKLAQEYLNDAYLFLAVGRVGGVCQDVTQVVVECAGREKRNKLEQILRESGTDRTLVFVEKKKDADFLAQFLSQRNYPATSMNGDRTQQEREQALKDFRNGVAPVLIATSVAARGLDINDVKHVINFDLPNDLNEYTHRVGRTGRIGNKGLATSFYDAGRDENHTRGLVRLLTEAEQDVPDWLEDAALRAVGTGYGADNSHSRDQRSGGGGGRPNGTAVASKQNVVEEEDEEW